MAIIFIIMILVIFGVVLAFSLLLLLLIMLLPSWSSFLSASLVFSYSSLSF